MGKLHLFNPENDLALAHGNANFTPPKAALALHNAAQALPIWYAAEGDCVYAPDTDPRWWDNTCRRFGLNVSLGKHGIPAPWGWSEHAAGQFRKIGIDGPFPDISVLRNLSHRRTARLLHRTLEKQGNLSYPLPPEPKEITDIALLPDHTSDFFLKAPWSGSGRGVTDCSSLPRHQIIRLAAGIIRRQGSVMLETRLPKERDFAMLFHSDGKGNVTYRGLSLFFNGAANSYGGNIVATQDTLRGFLDTPHADETAAAVATALRDIIGNAYEGPLGVDMMLYGSGSQTLICPTVEVNLRMTMGHLAMHLSRFVDKTTVATFRITPADIPVNPDDISLLPSGSAFTFSLSFPCK